MEMTAAATRSKVALSATVAGMFLSFRPPVSVLGQPHDGIFGARGAVDRQRIGQVDAPDGRQLVAGEPIQKGSGPRPLDQMFGKGGRIDQAHALADRLGTRHHVGQLLLLIAARP